MTSPQSTFFMGEPHQPLISTFFDKYYSMSRKRGILAGEERRRWCTLHAAAAAANRRVSLASAFRRKSKPPGCRRTLVCIDEVPKGLTLGEVD
jgi:hypothetical protein